MRQIRFALSLLCLLISCSVLQAQTAQTQASKPDKSDKLTAQGKLTRVMAIGAETSGWAIELNPPLTVSGKEVSSIEVVALDSKKLEALANQTVKAKGILSNATGVETGQRPVLNLTSIKALKEKPTKEK
jgi:hypothetical protein